MRIDYRFNPSPNVCALIARFLRNFSGIADFSEIVTTHLSVDGPAAVNPAALPPV
jgi:hypothetical protein